MFDDTPDYVPAACSEPECPRGAIGTASVCIVIGVGLLLAVLCLTGCASGPRPAKTHYTPGSAEVTRSETTYTITPRQKAQGVTIIVKPKSKCDGGLPITIPVVPQSESAK